MNSIETKLKIIYGGNIKKVRNSEIYILDKNKLVYRNRVMNIEYDEILGFGVLAYIKKNYINHIINISTGEVLGKINMRFTVSNNELLTYSGSKILAYNKNGICTKELDIGRKIMLVRWFEDGSILEVLTGGKVIHIRVDNGDFKII